MQPDFDPGDAAGRPVPNQAAGGAVHRQVSPARIAPSRVSLRQHRLRRKLGKAARLCLEYATGDDSPSCAAGARPFRVDPRSIHSRSREVEMLKLPSHSAFLNGMRHGAV
ncbi:hypothetical protein [Burkholderia glumae]|uniref:hypothetical protein n=1 Tax=Burkholderia glumae TaxID=337 RepID=UPI0004784087|nr:hypothetical protein [Burkholderia glumae]QHE13507.1 hypothetical protein GQR88_25110 [Burkholderia glumae AU6208]